MEISFILAGPFARFDSILQHCVQGPNFSERLAAVEGELTLCRKEAQRLADDNRGMIAQLRAKDKELDVMGERVQEAQLVLIKNKVHLPIKLTGPVGCPSQLS